MCGSETRRKAEHRETPESILLMRPDHIGDLLLTTPALYALRKGFPEAHISILVGSWSAGLLRGNPDPDEVIVCDLPWLDRGSAPAWRPLLPVLQDLRARRFDCTINFRVAAKAALFSRLCGGKQRWGFDVLKSRWAWTHTVPYSPGRHVVDNYLNLVHALGVPVRSPRFRIFPEVEDHTPVDELLGNGPPPVVLGITAGYPDKFWAPQRWAAVADHIAGRGFRVLLNGGPSEGKHIEAVQGYMRGKATSLAGRFNLLQLAALLKRCACIVTLDSFVMHLGVAVGVPLVALFGATQSRQWGPYPGGRPAIVVEPPPEVPRNAKAMQWIQVHHVIGAFEHLLKGP